MKKVYLAGTIILVVLATLLLFPACQSTRSATASKMLKFNFEKGKGYDYEMIMNMDQDVNGQQMQMDMTTYYSMDVTAVEGNTKTLTTRFDRFKMKVGANGVGLEVDSDKPLRVESDSSGKRNPIKMISSLLGAIRGQRFQMKVDDEGNVLEVSGFSDMAQRLVDSMKLEGKEREQMMAQFNSQFNETTVKNQFEKVFHLFPNKTVKVGDTWTKNSDVNMMGSTQHHSTIYTVKEIEGDMVTLDESTKIEGGSPQAKFDGKITGTIVIDSRTGLVMNADEDMSMKTTTGENRVFSTIGKTKVKGKARE